MFRQINLQKVQNEGEEDESQSDPLGPLAELGIHGLGLSLEGIAVAAAADSAADAGALAGLEHDDSDKSETGEKLNDGEYEFDDFHYCFILSMSNGHLPTLVNSHGKYNSTDKDLFQVFFCFSA